jgi:putative phosphoesterase
MSARHPRHHRETVELPEAGRYRLALVSDTHSAPHSGTLPLLRTLAPDRIVHAGDIGRTEVLARLAEVAPCIAVRGNIDGHAPETPDHLTLTLVRTGGATLRLLVTHIALRGPRLLQGIRDLAKAERAGLVVCGHSHVPHLGRDGGLIVFNPGSVGPRRFSLPITLGTLDLGPDGASLRHWDCETGAEWSPPGAP